MDDDTPTQCLNDSREVKFEPVMLYDLHDFHF